MNEEYIKFLADLKIVNKENDLVPFVPNKIQERFLTQDCTNRVIILKARQQGFSSIINAMMAMDFLTKPNTYNVVVADDADNAEGLLKRVKDLIHEWEITNGLKLKFATDSKYHLYFSQINTNYIIGTAMNPNLARSKTITNLHLSEAAFYRNFDEILAGAAQAVIPTGRIIIETTANGFNKFKEFWDSSKRGETGYRPLFYKGSDFYSTEFLDSKKKELKDMFVQEYPEDDIEAFVTSGNKYFEGESLKMYLKEVSDVTQIP